jgi:subtilisin family serine protease
MRRSNWRLAGIVALLACFVAPAGAAQYILNLSSCADIAQVAAQYGLTVVRPLSSSAQGVYLVSIPDPVDPAVVQQMLADPAISQVESDSQVATPENQPASPVIAATTALSGALQDLSYVPYFSATVRDSYANQPVASLINLPAAQAYATGAGVVAVIDTGVDPDHPALQGVLLPGYDFTRAQPGPASDIADLSQSTVAILDQSTVAILDGVLAPVLLNQSTVAILDQSTVAILDGVALPSDFGHGTMVAGLVHLVAPTAQIMPLKAFAADGSADLANVVQAIYYAVDNGATVINMSFGSDNQSPSIKAAVQYALWKDVICVAAVGNDGLNEVEYPAGIRGVIGVGSTDANDQRSVFSNYSDSAVDVSAPGEALITTYPGNHYAGVWGTSFSAALVSGAAALLGQIRPGMEPNEISWMLRHGHPLSIPDMGSARLDVLASALFALNPPQ